MSSGGIRVPALRKLCAKWHNLPLDQTEMLLHSAYHEDRFLALVILVHKFAKADDGGKEIYNLYLNSTRFINNWDLVDCSAEYIVGAHLIKEREHSVLDRLAVGESLEAAHRHHGYLPLHQEREFRRDTTGLRRCCSMTRRI